MIELTPQQELAAITLCNQLKQQLMEKGKLKKERMKRSYAYFKNQFFGDDLLPIPASMGSDNDNNAHRPEIFIPITREQIKTLYAYLKLTLFPNNEDFFRVKGKTATHAQQEHNYTEALKYLFKQSQITEKLGLFLLDTLWAGFAVCHPTYRQHTVWEWTPGKTNKGQSSYNANTTEAPPILDLEIWDPLLFYLEQDSHAIAPSSWGYFTQKTSADILASPWVRRAESTKTWLNALEADKPLSNKLFDCDLYYLPEVILDGTCYNNMVAKVVNGSHLVEFRPNMMPSGLPPVVYCTWMADRETPYGTGPAEDIQDLQRLINILYNYQVETLSRIGNRFIVKDTVDLTHFFGIAGGIATTQNPQTDIVALNGDYTETSYLSSVINGLKQDIQQLTGTLGPLNGGNVTDWRKTATEVSITHENNISINREVVEHLATSAIQPILERLMLLAGFLYDTPLTVRTPRDQGSDDYLKVNLGDLDAKEAAD
jgi:hypothetical protein